MNNKQFVAKLERLGACTEAVEWVKSHGGTAAECWRDCQRGDWMAWLAAKTKGITRRQLVGALADCAALSLKYYEAEYPDDKRVRECLDTCRRYAAGKATDKELNANANAAAAYAAANAANAAADAYAAAYANVAREETLKQCADIFRRRFPDLFKGSK